MKDRTAGIPLVRFIKVNKSLTFLSRQKTLHTLRQACCPDLHNNTWQNALFHFMFHSFVTLTIAYRVMYLWWDIHLLQSILNTVSWQLFYVQGYYNFAWTTLIFLMKSKWFCHRIKSHHYSSIHNLYPCSLINAVITEKHFPISDKKEHLRVVIVSS